MPKSSASPWPPTCSAGELSALLGLSGRRLRELAEEGVISRAAGRYRTLEAVQAYTTHLREAATRRQQPSPELVAQAIDGRAQRARLAKLQADRVELELDRERGRLVEVEPLKIRLSTMVVGVRNKLLAVAPTAKGRLPHLTVDDMEAIEDMIREALESLASDPKLFGLGAEDDADVGDAEDET